MNWAREQRPSVFVHSKIKTHSSSCQVLFKSEKANGEVYLVEVELYGITEPDLGKRWYSYE